MPTYRMPASVTRELRTLTARMVLGTYGAADMVSDVAWLDVA